MKYRDLYPAPPRQFFSPEPAPEVEAGVWREQIAFPCDGCGEYTSFTVSLGSNLLRTHCCSRSCRAYIEASEEDSRREDPAFYAALEQRPSSSPVEQSPDVGEAEGSTPSLGTE